jgi:hypothetical protein
MRGDTKSNAEGLQAHPAENQAEDEEERETKQKTKEREVVDSR